MWIKMWGTADTQKVKRKGALRLVCLITARAKPISGYRFSSQFRQLTLGDEANYNQVLNYELLLQRLQ